MAQRNEADILTLIHIDLYDAVRRVLEDGLEPQGANGWSVVTRTATLGPATRAVHELVAELKENAKMTDEERLRHFFNGLLKLVAFNNAIQIRANPSDFVHSTVGSRMLR